MEKRRKGYHYHIAYAGIHEGVLSLWNFQRVKSDAILQSLSMLQRLKKKAPVILSVEEVTSLLKQPSGRSSKKRSGIRRCWNSLCYGYPGLGTDESQADGYQYEYRLYHLPRRRERQDNSFQPGGEGSNGGLYRECPFGADEKKESDWLFVNCNGGQMSRQGFWKIINLTAIRRESNQTSHRIRCGTHFRQAHLIGGELI